MAYLPEAEAQKEAQRNIRETLKDDWDERDRKVIETRWKRFTSMKTK